MKKTTITITFSGDDDEVVADLTKGVDLRLLLRDALGEFVAARTPAEAYVTRRYVGGTASGRSFKIRDIEKRCRLAEVLKRGEPTITVEG